MKDLRLITIGPSHYCEKARWALDRAGVRYVEEAHLPMLHWAHVYPVTRTRTVPVLLGDGPPLTESRDIVRYADRELAEADKLVPSDPALRERIDALEARFDAELGPATRRHVYCHLVKAPEVFEEVFRPSLAGLEAKLLPVLSPVVRKALAKAFKVSDRAAERTRASIEAVFDDVAKELGDRSYLVGDRLTAADLAFVSLAGPVLLLDRSDAEVERLPGGFRDTVRAMRAHPAGRYARRIHDEHRTRRVGRAPDGRA
jgi:glutathione S-transferase